LPLAREYGRGRVSRLLITCALAPVLNSHGPDERFGFLLAHSTSAAAATWRYPASWAPPNPWGRLIGTVADAPVCKSNPVIVQCLSA
jgi:hypothetical protein